MKKRFFLAAMLSICIMLFISVKDVPATDYVCDIVYVGASVDGTGYIGLNCPGLGTKWWYANNPESEKQFLGIALTALSLGKQVIGVPTSTTDPIIIRNLYIKN